MDKGENDHVATGRNSKPANIGVENRDAEDMSYMTSRKFWEMIERRRKRPTMRLAEVTKELVEE
jgi:hypothetical protein